MASTIDFYVNKLNKIDKIENDVKNAIDEANSKGLDHIELDGYFHNSLFVLLNELREYILATKVEEVNK